MSAAAGSRQRPFAGDAATVERLAAYDWARVATALDAQGHAVLASVLTAETCASLARGYANAALFRKRVIMDRHGFGRGQYQYFAYPLPEPVASLRSALYARLAEVANRWNEAMGLTPRYPQAHDDFLGRCHEAGQAEPTPLLLQYEEGDYNCLHQDLYGEHVFPLQIAILLSRPGDDFGGGEFVLTEQRPRMQSRVQVVPLRQGDGVIFAVNNRPVAGTRGTYRVRMRHGVSGVSAGHRHTLGIIFHDALT